MATKYTSKIKFKVWKRHVCSGCGAAFRYVFEREKEGSASTEAAAQEAARKAVASALASEVDPHPCPHCGIYQGPMVKALKDANYGCLHYLALVGAPIVLLILACTDVLGPAAATWGLAGAFALTFYGHLRAASLKPNADRAKNADVAQAKVAAGVLVLDERGRPEPEVFPGNEPMSGSARFWLLVALVALLFVPAADLGRLVQDWPANAGWFPPVAGPGDKTYVYLPREIDTLKGYWKGKATVVVGNAAEVGIEELAATTKHDSWGSTIRAKSSEKSSKKTLWAEVAIPDDPKLAGKKLDLAIRVEATFPHSQSSGWVEETEVGDLTTSLVLAPPHAGATWRILFWAGFVGGAIAFLVASLALGGALTASDKGEPTTIVPFEGQAS